MILTPLLRFHVVYIRLPGLSFDVRPNQSSPSCKTRDQFGSEYTEFIPVRLAVFEKSRGRTDRIRS